MGWCVAVHVLLSQRLALEDMYTVCALLEFAGGHALNLEIMALLHFRAGKTLNNSSSLSLFCRGGKPVS